MLASANLPYNRMRQIAERRAADDEISQDAQNAHNALADRYGNRVWAIEQQQQHGPQSPTALPDQHGDAVIRLLTGGD